MRIDFLWGSIRQSIWNEAKILDKRDYRQFSLFYLAYTYLYVPLGYLYLWLTTKLYHGPYNHFDHFDSRDFVMGLCRLKTFSHISHTFSSCLLEEELFLCLSTINATICAFLKPHSFLSVLRVSTIKISLLSQVFKFFPFSLTASFQPNNVLKSSLTWSHSFS